MMPRRGRSALWVGWTAGSAVLALVTWRSSVLHQTEMRRNSAQSWAESIDATLEELSHLRQEEVVQSIRRSDENSALTLLLGVLAEARLPRSTLVRFEPESDRFVGGEAQRVRVRLQSIRVEFGELRLREVGALLEAWRANNERWRLSRIEMTPDLRKEGDLTDPRWTLLCKLEARYVDDEEA